MSDYENTLDDLPSEGKRRIIIQKRLRQECEICGELAHYKLTFLLLNARTNPASKAYRHDDCSWCEDAHRFVCREHERERKMEGYGWCSSFPATARFEHMFLYWKEEDVKDYDDANAEFKVEEDWKK